MPLRIYYQNDSEQACTIRPTPLVSISTEMLKNGASETFGVTYRLTLTGTLLADKGSPYGKKLDGSLYPFIGGALISSTGPYGAFDNDVSHSTSVPPQQSISDIEASNSIFFKQKALRALFAKDGQLLEISDFNDDEPTIVCYPRLISIDFQEGVYVDKCDYTIVLECDTLLDKDLFVDMEGVIRFRGDDEYNDDDFKYNYKIKSTDFVFKERAAFITDYNETWSIEVDDTLGESLSEIDITGLDPLTYTESGVYNPRSYRITHTINATGKTHYSPKENYGEPDTVEKVPAWQSAKNFVQTRIGGINDYPNVMGKIGSGTLNLIDAYKGFNHIRTEELSESNGTYSVFETWLIATGIAYESYTMSINSSLNSPFVSVSIDGNIKGLTQIPPSGYNADISTISGAYNTAYQNALNKYNIISNSGQFGLTSDLFARANNTVAVQLNSQPTSVAIGSNPFLGEVSYGLNFDNRPTNIISGVLSETISVNDTYPGDIFAIIPVIGRTTGPVLQYIGGRTEYKRDVSISLLMDYMKVPYGGTRNTLLLQKPSVIEPTATQLSELINELSPANESGVRKYFLSPPSESWNPKEGSYNLNLSWTYELDK